ncbi:sensor histidine kinase [Chloroflexota bacterium]
MPLLRYLAVTVLLVIVEVGAAALAYTIQFAVLGSLAMGIVLVTLLFWVVLKADRRLARQRKELVVAQVRSIQSAKLAAVGELVSGVAHELNNPLTGIWGLAQLLNDRYLDDTTERELAMIQKEAERCIGIVRNLLAFARPAGEGKTYASINSVVEAAVELRRYELALNNIQLEISVQPDLPDVIADVNMLQQVVLNLILNAEQAMLEFHGRGRLLLKTERVGPVVSFMVWDNGPGISKENLSKVFDPFYTTKDVGKGTGLGLSICYSIIQAHGGRIYVESEPPNGATFIVEIPIAPVTTPILSEQEDAATQRANRLTSPLQA